MKSTYLLPVAAAAAMLLAVAPAAAQQSPLRCFNVKTIKDTVSKDGGKTLTFTLQDGTTLVNRLQSPCPGIELEGFVWATAPNGEVCENSQVLHERATGMVCRLGKFDPPVKAVSKPAR